MSQSYLAAGAASEQSVMVESRGPVAVVRIMRAQKRNAIDDATLLALEAAFADPPADARALVLAGDGEHFCAGLDLSELTEKDVSPAIHHSRMWHRVTETIEFGRLPVVSALHGAVVGGGMELASATHVRVAERNTFFALPEGQRGIFVGGGGSVRLPKLIGTTRMMDMMLTGRVLSAEEGAQIGMAHYLVEDGQSEIRALELAAAIAGNAPMTNFALMHGLPRIADADRPTGYLIESLLAAIAQDDQEAKTRMRDFLEKRGPKVRR